MPNHGIFVENRLRQLLTTKLATSIVVAPVPWFPSRSRHFGKWARHAEAARREVRDGLEVSHPRYLSFPKVGMSIAPAALFAAASMELRRLIAAGAKIDVIDGHYLYPDGVAAVALGRAFGKPVVLTARGSDVTQFPEYLIPRHMIQWAMREASALISVSAGLKASMIDLGAPDEKITVLRNGIDLDRFRFADPSPIRSSLRVTGKLLLSVGHLIPRKRHHLAIEALADLPGWTLALVGEGPEKDRLKALAVERGIGNRVIFCGAQPHEALPSYYSAADVFILASSREGWANVLLESLACGTPVVASNIPGNPEVINDVSAGEIVRVNTPMCFAETISRVYSLRISRDAARAYAENFSWDATSQGQLRVFNRVLRQANRKLI